MLRVHLDLIVVIYLDDIFIYSELAKEHIIYVQEILTCLKKTRLLFKPKKCEFYKNEVTFLGFIVKKKGIKINPEKIRAIFKWPQPTTAKEILGFLGFTNFNRIFIKDYLKKAIPLTNLIHKNVSFKWDSD